MSEQKEVRFGDRITALFGILIGAVMALGATYLVLVYGSALGVGLQATIIIIAIAAGGLISLTSAFFGLLMPNKGND